MAAKNMTLKEMKDKIVDNYYDTFTDEKRTKTFDDLCSSNYITEYTYGIKNFPELGWHYNLEKHYNVIIPIEYLFTHNLAIQASENYEEEILENDDDKLVISYHNYGGDW